MSDLPSFEAVRVEAQALLAHAANLLASTPGPRREDAGLYIDQAVDHIGAAMGRLDALAERGA